MPKAINKSKRKKVDVQVNKIKYQSDFPNFLATLFSIPFFKKKPTKPQYPVFICQANFHSQPLLSFSWG
jgi:hypothetical protein